MSEGDRWIYFLRFYDSHDAYFHAGRYPIPNEDLKNLADEIMLGIKTREEWLSGKITFDYVDTSVLGVWDRHSFDFMLYAEILEHFQIKTLDWSNPGQEVNARLIRLS